VNLSTKNGGNRVLSQAETPQKDTGQYFTARAVASFLTKWAVRKSSDRVLEPSAGDGAFLQSLQDRFDSLGVKGQVLAVEIDKKLVEEARRRYPRFTCIHRDFFELTAEETGLFDVVVGNPPFIRYQRFNGSNRRSALEALSNHGVSVSGLSSSWVPFLIHSMMQLRSGGRLAVVALALYEL